MKSFRLEGAITARDFIQDAIAEEYQLEITGHDGRKLLVVFYKGTWCIEEPGTGNYVQMYDAPDVLDTCHTSGLCDLDSLFKPNPLWVVFCRTLLEHYSKADNGTIVTKENIDDLACRTIPAKILTDLVFFILDEVEGVNIIQAGRNGFIKNGEIITY